jgi:hypothetical protein
MNDTITKVREQYSASGLTGRIQAALATIAPEGQTLTGRAACSTRPVSYPRHPRHCRVGGRRRSGCFGPRAGSGLRHRRAGALSCRHFRL